MLIFIAVIIVMAMPPTFADAAYTPKSVSKLVADVDGINPSSTGRIPLILIHGVHGTDSATFAAIDGMTTNEKAYFLNFINYFYSSDLKEKYQLYRFHYLSDQLTVKDIGQGLREWLDDFIQNKKIKDGKIVILAHSMGGLVARSYMEEQQHLQGTYASQFGGARVEKLITLATPHHGSPGANGASRDALMANAALWQGVVQLACFYYNSQYSFATAISDSAVNRSDLRTDNFAFDNNTLIMNDNAWLTQLNQNTFYDNKMIAYYGSIDLNDTERTLIYNEVLNSSPLYLPIYASQGGNHQKLLVANIIMNEGLNAHFPFNDGMVPEDSAKFGGHTLNKPAVKMTNYDHEQMKDGRNLLPNELFDLLNVDLNNIYTSSSITPIVAAEYFIDIDPGEGNGFALPAKDGAFDTTMEDVELSLPTSNLTIGAHNLYIRMKNINGLWGTPRKIMFYVEGNKYIAGEEYYIDADPGVGNGIPVTASDGLYNAAREVGTAAIDTSNLSTGLHILYVRAKDSEGHWGTSRHYMFEVLNPPVIVAAEYYVDTDPGQGGGTALNAVDASFDSIIENISGTLNTSSLSAGDHSLYVRAKDSYGRWGGVSEAIVNVTVDTTPPVVNAGGNQTRKAVFTQTATATDTNVMTYAWSKQAGPGTVTFGTATGLSTTITASLEGTYTIRFTATDAAGNSSFSDITLVWDTTPPVAVIGAPSAMVTKAGPVTYTVSYTGADAVTLAAANVTLNKTGTADGTIAVSGTGNTARTVTISDITGDGTLGISIAAGTASDVAGNQAIASGPSATFIVDNTPPVVNTGGNQTKNGLFTQTATGTDTNVMTYAWSKQAGPGTVTFGTATGLSMTITASLDGTYTIRFTATDAAGNSAFSDMTLVWDTTPPELTLKTVTTPTGLSQQTITGTVTNAATVTVTTDTAASDGTASINANTWSYTITGLVEGTNGVTVTARDAADNVATATTSIMYVNAKGDVNGDWVVDLQDAITALQVFSGMTSAVLRADFSTSGADVNDDGRLGLEEVLYILQKLAGMREQLTAGTGSGSGF